MVVILMVVGCQQDGTTDLRKDSSNPTFHWFDYEGNDPVYQQINKGDNEYLNPVLPGFYPDPSIVRTGDDYYLVNSSFAYFPGIPIFHSKDLVNWTQIGNVMNRPSQMDLDSLGISRGIFAPTINYHDGTYYVICTLVDAGGNFLVTAEDPAGPWSDPIWLPKVGGIDPSMFFDDDGKVYILNNDAPKGEPKYQGHRAIWIQEYDPERQEIVGDKKMIVDGGVDISKEPIWIEAPHLMKIDGEYMLICAEGGTGPQHSEVVFKSDSPWGPYEPYKDNPILTQRHLDPDRPNPVEYAGHADLVKTQNDEWWAVFLAVRPYEDQFFNIGRETFLLPVEWKDGWPIILERDKTVPFVRKKPDLPEQAEPTVPHNGNFSYRDEFKSNELLPQWLFIRTVRDTWYQLNADDGGSLTIEARQDKLSGLGQPSYIGWRQQHAHAEVTTSMTYNPGSPEEAAGLVAFQNRDYHYFFGATKNADGQTVVQLSKRAGDQTEHQTVTIASEPIKLKTDEPLLLQIKAKGDTYDFLYGYSADDLDVLKSNADGTILSTQVAGGFVGTTIGMYAQN